MSLSSQHLFSTFDRSILFLTFHHLFQNSCCCVRSSRRAPRRFFSAFGMSSPRIWSSSAAALTPRGGVLLSSSAVVHFASKKARSSRGVVHHHFFVSPTTSPKNKTLQRGGVQKPRGEKQRGEHSRNRALADDVTELSKWSADEQKKAVAEILENVDDGGARKSRSFFSFLKEGVFFPN